MKMSRAIWVVVAIIAAGLALFMYSYAGGKPATHSVTLHWSGTANTTSYNVYRAAISGGPYQKIGTASTPQYVDNSVTSGAVFYYVVTSVSQGKESAYSKEISAAVP
jgi:fibronectin type 3 domain-containing protein